MIEPVVIRARCGARSGLNTVTGPRSGAVVGHDGSCTASVSQAAFLKTEVGNLRSPPFEDTAVWPSALEPDNAQHSSSVSPVDEMRLELEVWKVLENPCGKVEIALGAHGVRTELQTVAVGGGALRSRGSLKSIQAGASTFGAGWLVKLLRREQSAEAGTSGWHIKFNPLSM